MDADGDGILDTRDQEILISTSVGERMLQFELEFPLNPQRFSAIDGIEREGLWVVGRSNGGLGSLRPQQRRGQPIRGHARCGLGFCS